VSSIFSKAPTEKPEVQGNPKGCEEKDVRKRILVFLWGGGGGTGSYFFAIGRVSL
jgi:hypothetical protein